MSARYIAGIFTLLLALPFHSVRAEQVKIETLLLAGAGEGPIKEVLTGTLPIAARQMEEFGSDTAVVYYQRAYSTQPGSYRFVENKIWWVREGEAEDLTSFVRDFSPSVDITNVQAFVIRPGEFSVNAALSGKIEQLGPDRIHLQDGDDKEQYTNLVVAFESAKQGDIIGVSIAGYVPHSLRWKTWYLAEKRPVARSELRMICDNRWAYIVFGQKFDPGQMEQEILGKERGQIRDLRLRAEGIDPLVDEPFSPPSRDQSPSLRVVWRGVKSTWDGKHSMWVYYGSWNQIAAEMALKERDYLAKTKKVDKMARSLTSGLAPVAAVDSLYRFVQDDLQTVSLSLFKRKKRQPTVENILEVRAGEDFEKAYLLLAMIRALDIHAELIWAHDPVDGNLFAKYPSWGQMDLPLVKAFPDSKERWYDLNCRTCQPGSIHPLTRGVEAMTYLADADKADSAIYDELVADAWGREVDFFDMYLRRISTEEWCTMIETPGLVGQGGGYHQEKISLKKSGSNSLAGQLDIKASGMIPLVVQVGQSADQAKTIKNWLEEMIQGAKADSVLALAGVGADTLRASVTFDPPQVVPPMGDTWIIPAQMLLGKPHIRGWSETRSTPFVIKQEREYFREVILPLPEGWAQADVPPSCHFGFKCLSYQADFSTREGHLVLRRHVVEKPIEVMDQQSLDLIGREMRKIIAFESSPIVLQRSGS